MSQIYITLEQALKVEKNRLAFRFIHVACVKNN